MLLVARIDTLRAVTDVEVLIHFEAGFLLQEWHAKLLGGAGINGGLIHHDIASLQHATNRLAGLS